MSVPEIVEEPEFNESIVVEAKTVVPVAFRLVVLTVASCELYPTEFLKERFSIYAVNALNNSEKRFCEFKFLMVPVADTTLSELIFELEIFVLVKFSIVVEPSVVEPVLTKLLVVSMPEIVEDPEFKDLTDPFWAVKFASVVEAKTVVPVAFRLVVFIVASCAV